MTEANSEAREWMLTWTRSGIRPPDMFHPLADEYADIDDLTRDVDFRPVTPIADGILRFIEWYRSYHRL